MKSYWKCIAHSIDSWHETSCDIYIYNIDFCVNIYRENTSVIATLKNTPQTSTHDYIQISYIIMSGQSENRAPKQTMEALSLSLVLYVNACTHVHVCIVAQNKQRRWGIISCGHHWKQYVGGVNVVSTSCTYVDLPTHSYAALARATLHALLFWQGGLNVAFAKGCPPQPHGFKPFIGNKAVKHES